jgi:hypothetical protein
MSLRKVLAASFLLLTMGLSAVQAQDGSTLASGFGDNRGQALNLTPVVERPHYSYTWYSPVLFTSAGSDPVPSCDQISHSVWATFVAPQNGKLTITTVGSEYDTVLTVYQTSALPANEIACNDDFSGVQSQVIISTQVGVRYYVLIGNLNGSTGITDGNDNLTLNFTSNDEKAGAFAIPASGVYTNVQEDIQDAANDVLTTCNSASNGGGVWYTFKPTTTRNYEFNTLGSTYDTVLAVYTNANVLMGCNDDINLTDSIVQSRVIVGLTANVRYYVFVGRYSNTATTLDLTSNFTVRPR